ncbi:MAG: cation transporter [Acetatifactor sp.]|nr:cation transporter [Acetatifactor sp.]
MDRNRKIIQTSIVGIAVNLVLVIFKMIVGLMANSIAIILDAVNNMGDALSSIITIIGTKLAGKAPDKKHPYGYGRIEYLTSVLIAVIVLMAGLTSVRESADKILHPQAASYSVVSLVIIAVAVVAKFVCGRYVKAVGEKIHAQSLVASGSDAFFDSVLSFATLVAAVVNMFWQVSLEGILGLVISLIIIKAGVEMLLETLNSIIGERIDSELTEKLKEKVNSYGEVRGTYDLTLHNYGPTKLIGSVHIEVEDDLTARDIHRLTRQITMDVYLEFGIVLTVGIYAANTSDEKVMAVRKYLEQLVGKYSEILQMHGFYADLENQSITFDLIVDFKADVQKIKEDVLAKLREKYSEFTFDVVLDSDYSD